MGSVRVETRGLTGGCTRNESHTGKEGRGHDCTFERKTCSEILGEILEVSIQVGRILMMGIAVVMYVMGLSIGTQSWGQRSGEL